MIPVGIHENLVITNTSVTDEQNGKALNITFKQAGAPAANDINSLLGGTSVNSDAKSAEQNFKRFSFNNTKGDGTVKEGSALIKEVNARREQLNHILLQYMTEDKIDWKPELVTNKLGIKTLADLEKQIVLQSTLDAMFANQCEQFITMMKPFVGENGKKLYAKFNRTSNVSNFPKLPERWLDTQPFLAPMDDAAAKSKVKYSAWDVANKVNSPERNLAAVDASPEDLAKQSAAVNSVFGD